jgi:hypothetical protein
MSVKIATNATQSVISPRKRGEGGRRGHGKDIL